MATLNRRTLDIRWIKKPRYRKFVVIGSIIFSVNVFLVHVLVNSYRDPSLEEEDPSGRGRYHVEAFSQPEDDDPNALNLNSDVQFEKERKRHIAIENELLRKKKTAAEGPKPFVSSNKLNSAIGQSYVHVLKTEELDFVPECHITAKEAISAIHRARTQDCKRHIVNVTCLAQKKKLYPPELPTSCPAQGKTRGKHLGCFQDDMSLRLLQGYFLNLEKGNSPVNCTNLCLQSGFPYAGVEYWTECFCGIEPPPVSAKLPDSSCNTKCPGDTKQTCGGYLAVNIYETGIVKFSPQVANTVAPDDSPTVRITYLLTLSGRALRQVKRLIRALYHKDHFFFIHIDGRQDYLFRELIYLERMLPNVKLMRRRHGTMWAGSSLLQMLLSAMKEILELPWSWDFIVNLSESDFPIKSNDKLVEFLAANKGRNFVKSTGRDIQRFIQKQGLDKTFVECDGHMWRVGDRVLPKGIQMDGGSDWLGLSRPFVEYVTSEKRDDLLAGLDKIYKYTLLPAESFFHTVLRNSPFCGTYVDNNLHLTNWKRHLGCKCQYRHIVDWCGCSPNDFTPDDWSRITGTLGNQLFFARKFEAIINQGVINQLEDWVYGPPKATFNRLSYWQSIYHHADLTPTRDDGLVSLCTSLMRIASNHLFTKVALRLNVTDNDVINFSSYHNDDVFQGVLIHFKTQSKVAEYETWFKVINHFKVLDETNGKFIKNVYVSSDFDVKEQTTRSLHGALGPLSTFSLAYVVEPTQPTNLTFLFVDPAGQLAHVVDIFISDKVLGKSQPYIGSTKVSIQQPLLPGIWDLRVYHSGFFVAFNKFLVLPLNTIAGAQISEREASLLHSGTRDYRLSNDKSHWISAVEENAGKKSLALANAKRIGDDLHQWIDLLSKQFYTIVETCHMTERLADLEPCSGTVWSTASPDPKSSITSYDAATGEIS